MTPATGTALLLVGVFVLPGFVTALFRERTHIVRDTETPFDRLMLALFYSALIYALVFVVAVVLGADREDIVDTYRGRGHLWVLIGIGAAVSLLLPLAIALLGTRWRRSKKLRRGVLKWIGVSDAHSIRSGWNAMFAQPGTVMVRVVLKSGEVIGGWYGMGSLAGYSEHGGDLYISERWTLDDDDWFIAPAPDTLGTWIAGTEIQSVQLYENFVKPSTKQEEDQDEQLEAAVPAGP